MGIYEREYMQSGGAMAARATASERSRFIVKTYIHLLGAVLAFAGLEALLLRTSIARPWVEFAFGTRYGWLAVIGAFMIVSIVANKMAQSATSLAMQYAGLGLYIAAESFIFLPLLYLAANYASPDVIPAAGMITGIIFAGLTLIVFMTRKDFSFLRGALMLCGFVALGLAAAGAIFGFSLGIFFTVALIGLAAGYILYDTSNVLHHYRTDQHVSASLALFASVALMFYYVLSFLMQMQRRN